MKTFISWLTEKVNQEDDLPFVMDEGDVKKWIINIHEALLVQNKKTKINSDLSVYINWLKEFQDYSNSSAIK